MFALLFLVLIAAGLAGVVPVMMELSKYRRREGIYTDRIRYGLDDYIWSDAAPRRLRRGYALGVACLVVAGTCLAVHISTTEQDSGRRVVGSTLASIMTLVVAVSLIRKLSKHGL